MKKVISLLAFLITIQISWAQQTSPLPSGFQYQAIIRDSQGETMTNQDVTMKFSLLQGSASGSVIYVETHETKTNAFGLISLAIGSGTAATGTFNAVNWSLGSYFLKTEVDSGSGLEDFGISELLAVPYALYGEDADADATNEIQDISLDGTSLTISDGSTVDLGVLEGVDTKLTEAEVDAFVANNGYLTSSPFSIASNVVSGGDSDDDFVFGSSQLADDNATTDDNARMFFDKSKGAFRVGEITGDGWDDGKVGDYSVALGIGNIASEYGTAAIGSNNVASSNGSIAIGTNVEAKADYAIAAGQYVEANGLNSVAVGFTSIASGSNSIAIGSNLKAKASYELAVGAFNTDYTPAGDNTDRAFVIGNGTDASSLSDALTVYKNGNALLNGNLSVTDPTEDAHAATKKYVDDNDAVGAFTNTSNVISAGDSDDDFVFGASDLYTDGTRMFFDKSGGAFRAGVTSADEWAEGSVPQWSFASGYKTTASGIGSVAIGHTTTALELASTATGRVTTAAGRNSFSMGIGTTAASYAELAIGSYNTSYTASGTQSFFATDRAFVIGNGSSSTPSDALIVYKSGDASLSGTLEIEEPTADAHAATKLYVDNTIDNIADYNTIGNLDFKVLGYGEAVDINFDTSPGVSTSGANSKVGQSFKPNVSGELTRLVFKTVFTSTSGNQFVLYEGNGYSGTELAREVYTPGGTSLQTVDITLSAPISVTEGQSYTLAIEGTNVQLLLTNNNPYSDGQAFYDFQDGTWDIMNLTTYMSSRNTPQTAISANEVSVGIGTETPDTSAALDVNSTTGGLLLPRMTTVERDAISAPADGLVIYNTTTTKFQGRANGAWVDLH